MPNSQCQKQPFWNQLPIEPGLLFFTLILRGKGFFVSVFVLFFCLLFFVCLFAADGTCAGVLCHSNATCKNLIQGPTCECNDGYQGSGTECTGKWVNHMPNSKTASYSSYRVCQRPVVKGAMLHYLLSL